MRTEVLRDIKKTEEEYQTMISAAQDERKLKRSQAELEADNLVTKAQGNVEEYKKLKLEEARRQAALRHTGIITEGDRRATALKAKGAPHLSQAVQLLVARFKEQLHVNA
jgi:V/A-type H+/Na+-transporting ATPase subunit G/H